MNKEDLLNSLEELREQLNIGTKETTPIEEIERNLNFRREMEAELEELLRKVSDEQKYVVSNKEVYDKRKRDLKDNLALLEIQIAGVEEQIGYYNQRNNFVIPNEIANLQKAIASNNQRITMFQDEINKGNVDNNKVLTEIVNSIKIDIADLEKQIQNLEKEKVQNNDILTNLPHQVNSIQARHNSDQQELDDLEKKVSNVTYVDELLLQKDNDRIAELKNQINDSVINDFSSFDFVQAMNKIIIEVENENLTEQEVFERLLVIKEIYNNYYKLNDKGQEKVLGDVREKILFYEGEEQALRNKLDNKEENYRLPFAFENEPYKDEISNSDIDLKKYVNMLQSNNQKIIDCKLAIRKVELQTEQLSENYRLLGGGITSRLDSDNYKGYKLQKETLNTTSKELNLKLSNLNEQQQNIESQIKLIKKQIKIDDALSRKTNKEQILDVFAIKKDENKLKECTEMVESLKNKEQFISRNVEENIDLLLEKIKSNKTDKKTDEEDNDLKPIPFTFLGKAKDAVINKTKELWESKKIQKGIKNALLVVLVGAAIFTATKGFKKQPTPIPSPLPTYSSNKGPDIEKTPDFDFDMPDEKEKEKPADIEKKPTNSNTKNKKDKGKGTTPAPSPSPSAPEVPVETTPPVVEVIPPVVEVIPPVVEVTKPSKPSKPSNPSTPSTPSTPDKPGTTYVVNEGETLYYKNKDGKIEVFSNDSKKTSEDAAKDYEGKTGKEATGKTEEYEGINKINYNDDGSVKIGVENSTNHTETTLVEDIREGMTDKELERQNQEMLQIMKEMEAEEQAQKEGGMSR